MQLDNISNELWLELSEPSDLSIPSISFWLQANLGALNIAIRKCYTIDSETLDVSPDIGVNEKYIFKLMFYVYYYGHLSRKNLGAAASSVIQITQAGKTVRMVNKNEVSKNYLQLKNGAEGILEDTINRYRRGKVVPLQVAGDDTAAVINSSILTSRAHDVYSRLS
jgi:hypothetical protein